MLRTQREGDRCLVALSGELDHCCAQKVRRELDALIADPGVRWLILDFRDVPLMDSSGIGVILGRYRQMRERGGQVGVVRMNSHVRRIFRMSGLDRVIHHLDKQEAAQ